MANRGAVPPPESLQKLHLVGLTTDQKGLILSARRGARSGSYRLPLDEALATAIDEHRARLAEAEAEAEDLDDAEAERTSRVESALPVREIQARLRQGRTVQDVAKAAGVEASWVERFATPVFAEQAEVIAKVRRMSLKRARLGPSAHPIGDAILHNLAERGVALSPEEFGSAWSTRQLADGRWAVRFRVRYRGKDKSLRFDLDESKGSIAAADRLSGQLGYVAPSPAPAAPERPQRTEAEPRPTAKRATVTTGFRPEEPAPRPVSRSAKERQRASLAMRKGAAKRAVETERAAARKAKEKREAAVRRARAAKVEEARRQREQAAAERARAAAAKKAAAEKAKRKAARQAAAQARRAEAALVAAEQARAAEQAGSKAPAKRGSGRKSTTASPSPRRTSQARSSTSRASAARSASAAKATGARGLPRKAKSDRPSTPPARARSPRPSSPDPAPGRRPAPTSRPAGRQPAPPRATRSRSKAPTTGSKGPSAKAAPAARPGRSATPASEASGVRIVSPAPTPRAQPPARGPNPPRRPSDGAAMPARARRSSAKPEPTPTPASGRPAHMLTDKPGTTSDPYGPTATKAVFRAGLVDPVEPRGDGDGARSRPSRAPSSDRGNGSGPPPANRTRRRRPLRPN